MEIKELVKKLRNCGGGAEGIKLVNEAADKIEWLQKLIDDSTNDHFVDIHDFYSEQCHKLTEKINELQLMTTYINREEFSEILSKLKQSYNFLGELNDLFSKYKREDLVFSTGLEDTVVKILEILFKDKETQWIAYWVWELDFGEKYKDGCVSESDGTNIPLRTAENLYDLLLKNMRSKIND